MIHEVNWNTKDRIKKLLKEILCPVVIDRKIIGTVEEVNKESTSRSL